MILSFLRTAGLLALPFPFAAFGADYLVTTQADNGTGTLCASGGSCSLRAAIAAAEANPGTDRIVFDLPQGTVIALLSGLPTINEKLIIDARPSTDYTGRPWLELNGLATSDADGLRFGNGAAGSAVYGLGVADFDRFGIELSGTADGIRIDGCEIGRRLNGFSGGNGGGILALTDGNTIGQTYVEGTGFVGVGNLVIASAGDGIAISGNANTIYGNTLGDTVSSTGNNVGIRVLNGNDNHIGRVVSGERGGNGVYFSVAEGIWVNGDGNLIQGNAVGRTTGGSNRPNGGDGIVVGGQSNVVGGTGAFERNLVANNQTGIAVGLSATHGFNEIVGNQVMDNRGTGIRIVSGSGNQVRDNQLEGNGTAGFGDGVRIDGDANVVSGNHIGVGAGNNGEGVFVSTSGENNAIGPDNLIVRNVNGVKLEGPSNDVVGNVIGMSGFGNGARGVWVRTGAAGTLVEENTIDDNGTHGIVVESSGSALVDNGIGLVDGNGGSGILLAVTATNTTVGPQNKIGRNVDGIVVQGAGNRIEGNRIGWEPPGFPVGNARYGIWTTPGASGTRIDGNRIVDNGNHGLRLQGPSATVTANEVGGYAGVGGSFISMGNGGHGVFVQGADAVAIGDGTFAGLNHILYNTHDGVAIESAESTIVNHNTIVGNVLSGVALLADVHDSRVIDNRIDNNFAKGIHVGPNSGLGNSFRANRMAWNVVPGIDLAGDGPTANDADDADEGPNRLQNTPSLLFYSPVGDAAVAVGYSVGTAPGNADYPLSVEIFMGHQAAGDGSFEGLVHLGTGTYSAMGVTTVTVALPPEPSGWLIATATDDAGNTSEFSAAMPYVVGGAPEIFSDGFEAIEP